MEDVCKEFIWICNKHAPWRFGWVQGIICHATLPTYFDFYKPGNKPGPFLGNSKSLVYGNDIWLFLHAYTVLAHTYSWTYQTKPAQKWLLQLFPLNSSSNIFSWFYTSIQMRSEWCGKSSEVVGRAQPCKTGRRGITFLNLPLRERNYQTNPCMQGENQLSRKSALWNFLLWGIIFLLNKGVWRLLLCFFKWHLYLQWHNNPLYKLDFTTSLGFMFTQHKRFISLVLHWFISGILL